MILSYSLYEEVKRTNVLITLQTQQQVLYNLQNIPEIQLICNGFKFVGPKILHHRSCTSTNGQRVCGYEV